MSARRPWLGVSSPNDPIKSDTARAQPGRDRGLHIVACGRAVHPGRLAAVRNPPPASQPRSTSRTSFTRSSRNATSDLHVDISDLIASASPWE